MSSHSIPVVPVKLEEHPNADSLSIVKVGGYSVCVRTADWVGVDKGVYIPPDYVVETHRPEFTWLKDQARKDGTYRVRCKKLRKVQSWGMLIPAPEDSKLGDNFLETLGIKRWEPLIAASPRQMRSNEVAPPDMPLPGMYDIENLQHPDYVNILEEGEEVVITEKIHGANTSYVYFNDKLHVKTKKRWVMEEEGNPWWDALKKEESLIMFLRNNPGYIVFGEIYGRVQSLRYGLTNEVKFVAFDIWHEGKFFDAEESRSIFDIMGIPSVPLLYQGPYSFNESLELASGDSVLAEGKHIREGIVIKPVIDRYDHACGRVQFKIISPKYLEKS